MGKIKKILENELVEGAQSTDIYPVTSTKAVYNENNERLDKILEASQSKLSELDSVMLLLGTAPEDKSITIQRTASYINKNGEIITSSNNYSVSSPIAVNKGECLLVKASAFANQAVISTTNESGSVYTPKVLGESSSLVNRLYSYVAEADGYIAICGYNEDFPSYIKVASSDIINQIYERLSDTESMRPLLDGISDEIGYENKTETLTIQRSGYAIKSDGSVIQSDSFNVSNPVSLKMGQTIIVSGSAWVSRALIALTDEQGTAYTPVVLGESTTNLVSSTFRYTAQEDCYVAISSYVNDFPTSAIIRRSVILRDIQNNISKDEEKYGKITAESMPLLHGGWYNTFGKEVGDIATLAYNSHIDWSSINILVSKGDVFYVTGKAGNSPRLWAFLDSTTGEILEFSSATADETNKRIVAPRDCRLVVNVNIIASLKYGVMKENPTIGMISNRESFTHLEAISDNPLKKINYFLGYAGIIHHWGFVGDSLMGGFMENSGISQYEYSWGQRMCQLLGVEGYNFSVGGMTAKDWIYNTSGYNSQRVWSGAKTNLKQAYIIGLGVNDRNQSYGIGDVSTDVGTYDSETDSDTNAETFAGYYAGIIQRLQSVQPNAKIFVVTMPHNISWANVNDYNNVIRAMATKFSNVYVIDLYTYADNYYFDREWESNLFDSGHFNVIGYEYGASVMMTYIDWIIRNNYSDFKNVNMIEV